MSTVQRLPSAVEALLADGTTALIRPLAPPDHDAVLDLHAERMSDASRRMRYFGAGRRAPEPAADRLCGPPRPGFLALSAWVGGDLVGEADYESEPGHEDAAEPAVAVADEHAAVVAAQSLRQLRHDGKVALKAHWQGQLRRSAAGAVRTGPTADAEVRSAYREFTQHFGGRMAGAVVQPMAGPGLPGVDLAAMRRVLAGLSRMAADLPQFVEAELNPLIARADGLACVDARIRLDPGPTFDPCLRRLRRPVADPPKEEP